MGNEAITLGDSLAPLPWYLRVNLDVKVTNVLIHPRQRESQERGMNGRHKGTSSDVTGRKFSSVDLGTRRKTENGEEHHT